MIWNYDCFPSCYFRQPTWPTSATCNPSTRHPWATAPPHNSTLGLLDHQVWICTVNGPFKKLSIIEGILGCCTCTCCTVSLYPNHTAFSELLSVTCPSPDIADSMADLIDGYCRIVNNSNNSIWSRKGERQTGSGASKILIQIVKST